MFEATAALSTVDCITTAQLSNLKVADPITAEQKNEKNLKSIFRMALLR